MDCLSIKEQIRAAALDLGFARAGFAPVTTLPHGGFYQRWLAGGNAANMKFLARNPAARAEPSLLSPGARCALVVLAAHPTERQLAPGNGLIARYAWGPDYHVVIRQALSQLADQIEEICGERQEARAAVDTSPLLEREIAVAAGLGFIGKNNMLITPGLGSFTLIGVMLLPQEIPPDPKLERDCGSCRRCLDACPTTALKEPHLLDARRCISCLTIEERGRIPEELASSLSGWIFGCDICQEVCPYNARAPGRATLLPGLTSPPLLKSAPLEQLIGVGGGEHRRLVQGTAMRRTPRHHLRRNAALAAGSLGSECPESVRTALHLATQDHRPLVAEAAQWAIRQLN